MRNVSPRHNKLHTKRIAIQCNLLPLCSLSSLHFPLSSTFSQKIFWLSDKKEYTIHRVKQGKGKPSHREYKNIAHSCTFSLKRKSEKYLTSKRKRIYYLYIITFHTMKKQKKYLSAIQNGYVENKRYTYSLVVSWKEWTEKRFSIHKVWARELDIQKKARAIFYRIVKEESGMILHNIQKPFEQDRHNMKRKNWLFIEDRQWFHNQNINSFEYTFCKI